MGVGSALVSSQNILPVLLKKRHVMKSELASYPPSSFSKLAVPAEPRTPPSLLVFMVQTASCPPHCIYIYIYLYVVWMLGRHGDRAGFGFGGNLFLQIGRHRWSAGFGLEQGRGQEVEGRGLKWSMGSGISISLPSPHPHCCHLPTL